MRILVTGASGWIGSAATTELLAAGHHVVGLARSDSAATAIEALGAEVRRGDIDVPSSLRDAAQDVDGVVHLAYLHDFSRMADAAHIDRAAIDAFADVLAGTDAPLLITSGLLGLATDRPATESDLPDPAAHPRVSNAAHTLALADRGVRSIVVRFAPTVHGHGAHGFIAELRTVAEDRGVAGYVGDGTNRWPAVHVSDAGRLVRLAVESAPAGSVLHAAGEQGVPARQIADALGSALNLPTAAVAPADATEHFGWIGQFFSADCPASSEGTQALLGWQPSGPTLLEDIASGGYTARVRP